MSLNIRVQMPATAGAEGLVKVIRFGEKMSVYEACKNIVEKATDLQAGKDHGLYKPAIEGTLKGGKWLRPEKSLESYDLKTGDTVIFMKRHDQIKVKLVDGTIKTMLVDVSGSLGDVVAAVGEKIGLKAPEEYSFQNEGGVWFIAEGSLLEQLDNLQQILVLKKKFFVTDANVDKDDPISLHLVYIQSRDDIVAGKHPCAKDEAIQLAALQCQIDQGTMNPQAPKVEIEKVLAPSWRKEKGVQKAIIDDWKKLAGLAELNAKYRYVQFCRSLKTFGITLFEVQERKNKDSKKRIPKLLGFTRDGIIKMSQDCTTIEKQWPLVHLRRWAAQGESFTMDFGSHEEAYVVVYTEKAEEIAALIAGYIDIILKKQKDTGVVIDDDDNAVGSVSDVGKIRGMGMVSATYGMAGGMESYASGVMDLESAGRALNRMNQLFTESAVAIDLGADVLKKQFEDHKRNVENLASKFSTMMMDPNVDRNAVNVLAKQIAYGLEALINSARQMGAAGLDPDGDLLEGVKGLSDTLQNLLGLSVEVLNNPDDLDARMRLNNACAAANAAIAKLAALARGIKQDEALQRLLIESGRAVQQAAHEASKTIPSARVRDVNRRVQVDNSKNQLASGGTKLATITNVLAPTAKDAQSRKILNESATGVLSNAESLRALAKASGLTDDDMFSFGEGIAALNAAVASLLAVVELPEIEGGNDAQVFSSSAQQMLESSTALMGSLGKPDLIRSSVATIDSNSAQLSQAASRLASASSDPSAADRLNDYASRVMEAVRKLVAIAPGAAAKANDDRVHAGLRQQAANLIEEVNQMVADAGAEVALSALYTSAKMAAATTSGLVFACKATKDKVTDKKAEQDLINNAKATSAAIAAFIDALRYANQPADENGVGGAEIIMQAAEVFAPEAFKLVASCKIVGPKISDPNVKKDVTYNADVAAKSIHKLLLNRKAAMASAGSSDVQDAFQILEGGEADLEVALMAINQGRLQNSGKTREEALKDLNTAVKQMATDVKNLAAAAKDDPEGFGPAMKEIANSSVNVSSASKDLAGTVDDKQLQRSILNANKALNGEIGGLMKSARSVNQNPKDENLNKMLTESGKSVAAALQKLLATSKGVVPKEIENFQKNAGADLEDAAERELNNAARVINMAVEKIMRAQEEARLRREAAPDFNLDEANITEAILEACGAIGKATHTLIVSATTVQQEFNKLSKAPETREVYKRDPTWAQGLISAAQEVAASVQHLVTVSDSAVKGESSEEALVVGANQVSASTARLVAASTVKNVSEGVQNRLIEASKAVSAATRALVEAAKAAADFKDQMAQEQAPSDGDSYSLSAAKIAEMEQQMEILKLEKELQKKREALLAGRKNEYAQASAPKPAAPTKSVTANASSPTLSAPTKSNSATAAPPAKTPARPMQNSASSPNISPAAAPVSPPGPNPAPGRAARPFPSNQGTPAPQNPPEKASVPNPVPVKAARPFPSNQGQPQAPAPAQTMQKSQSAPVANPTVAPMNAGPAMPFVPPKPGKGAAPAPASPGAPAPARGPPTNAPPSRGPPANAPPSRGPPANAPPSRGPPTGSAPPPRGAPPPRPAPQRQ